MRSVIIILASAIITLLILLWISPEKGLASGIDISGQKKEKFSKDVLGYTNTMRLHTVEYTITRVLMMKEDPKELIPGKRRIAIPLTFTLTGYIDLNKITADNFSYEDGRYIISLPEAEVDITGQEGNHIERVSWNRSSIKDEEYEGELARIKKETLEQYSEEVKERAKEEFKKNIMPYLNRLNITSEVDIITLPAKD